MKDTDHNYNIIFNIIMSMIPSHRERKHSANMTQSVVSTSVRSDHLR